MFDRIVQSHRPAALVPVICVLLGMIASVVAESPSFKVFTTENGLAHDTVRRIVRDSHGFLWICTSEGLSRFDGARFTNFSQDQGLPHRRVTDFVELRDGTYLVGTSDGLVVFNPNGRPYRWNILESRLEQTSDEPPMFRTYAPQTDSPYKKSVTSIAQEPDGTVWVGMENGLFRLTSTAGEPQFEEVPLDAGRAVGVGRVIPYSKGGVVVVGSGIYHILRGEVRRISDEGAYTGIEDRDGRLLVGAGGPPDGLRVFEFDGDRFRETRRFTRKDGLADDTHIRTVFQTSDGRIFLGGDLIGIVEFRPDDGSGKPRFRTLGSDSVLALGEDPAGNLWVGTERKGAWQLPRSGFVRFGEAEGLSGSAEIGSIYTTAEGDVFLAVQPNKLMRLGDRGVFENVLPAAEPARSWGWNFLDLRAHDGEWWIPSLAGLVRYPKPGSPPDLARSAPKRIYGRADGLWSDEVFGLFEDSRGDIWVTTCCGPQSLSKWDRKTDTIGPIPASEGLPDANGPISFAEDRFGNVWFGHYFGKLTRWRNGKFETFGAADGLPESQIGDLLVDGRQRLWIATSGNGLFRIDDPDSAKPSFRSISTDAGLSSNQTLCLTRDRFGRIYAGTGHGIDRIDENDVIRTFTQSDGLPGNFITRCGADAKGDLWFVSQNALVRFTPENDRAPMPPPVFIDRLVVNGAARKISVLGEKGIDLPDLSSDQTRIEIAFFAITFGAGENIRYQYRLDGGDWSAPSDQQSVNLNLAAGQHSFETRAVRSDGVTSEAAANVSFRILPPVWQRWWFVAGLSAVVLLVAFSVYRYRIANLEAINAALRETKSAEEKLRRSREERLAELEQVRTRIATDLHDDIGASLTQIAILSEVARRQRPADEPDAPGTGPLAMIYDVSNELVLTMSDIVWAINPQKDSLHDLTLRMRRFASDVLSAKSIEFEFEAPEGDGASPLNSNLRREVFLIFKEAVNNIVKHSGADQVEIGFTIDETDVRLSIGDNGKGFDAENAEADAPANLYADYHGGNGLASMKRRAAELGGECRIVSAPGNGTRVFLRLPVTIQRGGASSAKQA